MFNGAMPELDEAKAAEVEALRPKPVTPAAPAAPLAIMGPEDKGTFDTHVISYWKCNFLMI